MNNLNETPLKIIKNYLLAREQPTNELKEKQMELISILTYDIPPNTNTVENYDQVVFNQNFFKRKCHNLIDLIPIKNFRDEWSQILNNYNFGNNQNLLMNIGERVTLNVENKIIFEEWRNVIDLDNDNKVIFSIHKTFIAKLYEIKFSGKDFCYILEIGFDGVKLDRNILINREVHRADEYDNLSEFTSDTEAESIFSDELNNSDSDNEINTNTINIFRNRKNNINNNSHRNSISLMPSSGPPKEFLFEEDEEITTFDENNFIMKIPDNDNNYPFNNNNNNNDNNNNNNNGNNNNNINNINNLRRHRHRRRCPNKVIDLNDFEDEELNQCSGSIRYTKYNGQVKSSYNSIISKANDRITSEATFENESDQIKETQKEEVTYQIDKKKLQERNRNRIIINENDNEINTSSNNNLNEKEEEEEEIPIIVSQVDTESTKIDGRNDYYETNFETYHINNRIKWGKKRYQNNKNRRYQEDWKKENNNGIKEEKYQKFLDDGCGKKTTEQYGRKENENNEIIFEYHDTNIYDVSNGDETTLKVGKDKSNEWNQKNYRNRIKNFSHVENYGRNYRNNLEWTEKWDEEPNGEKYCKKWGKSDYEEWEEEWKETYDQYYDNREKICVKKCKKLLEDKEWMETWTEKNAGKPNSEKTCYKMNKTNGYLFENYWGNVIVDHSDGKRKKYVGYNRNGDRKDYVDYTYENDNN